MDFIRHYSSPWAAPLLFMKRKNPDAGKPALRAVIDYRKLNAQTVKDNYAWPHIEDLIRRLGGAVIFSKMGLRSGWLQSDTDC